MYLILALVNPDTRVTLVSANFNNSDKRDPEEKACQSSGHLCSLCCPHSWLILQGTCAARQHLLALAPAFRGRPGLQPGAVVNRQGPSRGLTQLLLESEEIHLVVCLSGNTCIFSRTENKITRNHSLLIQAVAI